MDPLAVTVPPLFLLPYGNFGLQRIDQPLTCLKSGFPMSGAYGNHDTRFSNFHGANPMHQTAANQGPTSSGLSFQFLKLQDRHLLIAFVIKARRLLLFSPFAGGPDKQHRGPGIGRLHGLENECRINRLAYDLNHGAVASGCRTNF